MEFTIKKTYNKKRESLFFMGAKLYVCGGGGAKSRTLCVGGEQFKNN